MLKMHLEQVEHLEAALRDLEARADQGSFRVATELLMTILAPLSVDVTIRPLA